MDDVIPMDDPAQPDDRSRCTARSKRSGERCKRAPTTGYRTCRMHGGTPGSGRPWKHGRYSRVLGKLREPYERALSDRDLLDSTPDIALFDVRLEGLLERLEAGDESVWPEIVDLAERRSKRVEGVWRIKLTKANAINRADLVAILTRFLRIVIDVAGPVVGQRVTERVRAEIVRDRGLPEDGLGDDDP